MEAATNLHDPEPGHKHDNPKLYTEPTLCPFVVESGLGTVTFRGRARFAPGAPLPTTTRGGEHHDGAEVPAGTITWHGESFTARFLNAQKRWIGHLSDDIAEALDPGDGSFRVDTITWEATSKLEERSRLGCGDLVAVDGVPVAVEFENQAYEDVECMVVPAFRAAFGDTATLGEWKLTPCENPGWFSGRAEILPRTLANGTPTP